MISIMLGMVIFWFGMWVGSLLGYLVGCIFVVFAIMVEDWWPRMKKHFKKSSDHCYETTYVSIDEARRHANPEVECEIVLNLDGTAILREL